jgi:hypothetical protein
MDRVAADDEKQALAEGLAHARALAEQGDVKAALKQAERVRRAALAAEDVPVLEQVLRLARLVREQTEGKRRQEAGRLAYSARENIRFVGRKQALAEGREWIDPFQAPPLAAASGAQPLFEAVGGKIGTAPPGVGMLFVHLGASFLFCALWGVGALFYSTDDVDTFAFSWMGVWGVYWLVMAVLQIRWWRKGYEHFWRPTYTWIGTALGLLLLSIPAGLMFVVPWGEIAGAVAFFIVFLGSIAALLVFIPDFRRWLLQHWKPYDPLPSPGNENAVRRAQ